MVINTTRWRPDTCDCIVEYQWDSTQPEDSRTHTLSSIVNRCSFHAALADDSTVYSTILEENPRKNMALQTLIDNAPADMIDIEVGTGTKRFKNTVTVRFEWSGTAPNRVVRIFVIGYTLTPQQRNAIQNFLDNRFGAGKVILD